jgi:arsenate reductase
MKILFVCEYNACRSQMAEGLARALLPDHFSVHSAGLHPGEVNQLTAEVMQEVGVDLSSHRSKRLHEVAHLEFDRVIVLAEPAFAQASALTAKESLLWSFPDPVAAPGDPEEIKKKIRAVRDALKERILNLGKDWESGCDTGS